MFYFNNMEIIALTTAMADARAAIQAASREIRNYKRQVTSSPIDNQPPGRPDIIETLDACESIVSVLQVHLSYLARRDSLLVVPGTNAGNSGKLFQCFKS